MISFFSYFFFFYFTFNARYIGNIFITRIVILGFQHFFCVQLDRPITGGGGGRGEGEGGGEASFKSRGSLQAAVYSRRKT